MKNLIKKSITFVIDFYFLFINRKIAMPIKTIPKPPNTKLTSFIKRRANNYSNGSNISRNTIFNNIFTI